MPINNILNQEKTIKKTVGDLEQYANFPSNELLMLCELIDNSISSYIEKNDKENMSNLIIKITIDRRDKDNHKLTILDNAYGMSLEVFENAIYFGNPKELKKSSNLNVYGVGLKQAAFYIGRRIDVISKTLDSEKLFKTHIDLTELEKTEDKIVRFKIVETLDPYLVVNGSQLNSGTKIIISHLRKSRFAMDNSKDLFLQSLGWKYNRYIGNGLKIIINYLTNEEKSTFKDWLVLPSNPKAENYNEWKVKAFKDRPDKGEPDFLKFIEKKNESDWINDANYDEFMSKIVAGGDLIWDKVEIPITSEISVFGKIGILAHSTTIKNTKYAKQKWTKFNGFSLYQAGRAVACGPNEPKFDASNYNVIQSDIAGGINQKRRWFGEFDLDPLMEGNNKGNYIGLDTNKKSIKWIDSTARSRFDNFLKNFINKFDAFLSLFNSYQISYTKSKRNNTVISNDNIKSTVEASSKVISRAEILQTNSNKDEIKYVVNLFGFSKEINVLVSIKDADDKEKEFVGYKKERNDENNNYVLTIFINANHDIWKPLLEEKIGEPIQISLHKLAIVQGISQWVLDYVYDKDNTLNEAPEFLNQYRDKNYTEVFSAVANNIFQN